MPFLLRAAQRNSLRTLPPADPASVGAHLWATDEAATSDPSGRAQVRSYTWALLAAMALTQANSRRILPKAEKPAMRFLRQNVEVFIRSVPPATLR